jgi:hypothetical protein
VVECVLPVSVNESPNAYTVRNGAGEDGDGAAAEKGDTAARRTGKRRSRPRTASMASEAVTSEVAAGC